MLKKGFMLSEKGDNMEGYKVTLEGYDVNSITNMIVDRIVEDLDIDKLKNEVRNKIVKELKGDILNSKEVSNAIQTSFEKVDRIASNRVNEAVTQKINEINCINIGSFKLTIE